MKSNIPVFLAVIGVIHFSHVTLTSCAPDMSILSKDATGTAMDNGGTDAENADTTNSPDKDPTTTPTPAGQNTTTDAPGEQNTTTDAPGEQNTTTTAPGEETTTTDAPGEKNTTTDASGEKTTTAEGPGDKTTSTEGPGGESTTPGKGTTPKHGPGRKGKQASSFDGASFAGGIALGFGVLIIAAVAYTIYRRRATQQYNAM